MAVYRQIDWLKADVESQKKLYEVLQGIQNIYLIKDMVKLFAIAYADTTHPNVSKDFVKNFPRGLADKRKVAYAYQWVVENHLEVGVRLAPEIFDPSLLTNWEAFLKKQGRKAWHRAEVHFFKDDTLDIVRPAKQQPVSSKIVKLGDEFCYRLKSPRSGHIMALQKVKGDWRPVTVDDHNVRLSLPWQSGTRFFPFDPLAETVTVMSEVDDNNMHQFVFLIGSVEIVTECIGKLSPDYKIQQEHLDVIADRFDKPDNETDILRLNVIFE